LPFRRSGDNGSMGIGVSIILIAAGAILAFAVKVSTSGFNLHTIGWILLAVGALGLLLSLMFWSTWGGWGRRGTVVREDGPPV
jgi:Na+/proline symporter